jgi:mono/diheme cytochrome c family protein
MFDKFCSLFSFAILCLAVSLLTARCRCGLENKTGTEPASGASTVEPFETPESKLIAQGKLVYSNNCISCHNRNPKNPGNLGPEVFGSSKDLLTARLLRAEYPAGYTPKRKSHVMSALPHLAGDIDALAAYLNQN